MSKAAAIAIIKVIAEKLDQRDPNLKTTTAMERKDLMDAAVTLYECA